MLKIADGLTAKMSFHHSPRSSSPSVTGERPASGETSGPPTNRGGPSNLTRANVRAAAAAAEQKEQQQTGKTGKSSKTDEAERLNVEEDDDKQDDDPDMMSLSNTMISELNALRERNRKQGESRAMPADTAAAKTNHGRK